MITVMGAGAFGTALAAAMQLGGEQVTLWARRGDAAEQMRKTGENPKLPHVPLPAGLHITADLDAIRGDGPVLLAVPMQKLRDLLETHDDRLHRRTLVACCKGIELATGLTPGEVMEDCLPDARHAMLTGPSFAADIARGLPTALTLACGDETCAADLQRQLGARNLRLYRTTDLIGAQIGGALKNVIAIACGAAIGAGLGESARAALMTRGYAEMQRMALKRGARPETLAGLSGFGDLTLTCTSEQSRNYSFGRSIGRGEIFDPSITVEGAATARAVARMAEEMSLDMPITQVVTSLTDGSQSVADAMETLLSRPLKEESK